MAIVTIDTGNLYITNAKSTDITTTTITDGTTVQIQTTKLDYNLNNALKPIDGKKSSNQVFTMIVDLSMINEVISVQGFLIEEETERAITKRDNLIALAKAGKGLTAVWGQGNYQTVWTPSVSPFGVFIQKIMITETAGQLGIGFTGDAPPERSLAIQISLIRGKGVV